MLAFWAGLLIAGLLLGALPFAARARLSVGANLGTLGEFLGLNTPYTILAFPFETDFGPVFNMWALALCLVAVAWLARLDLRVEPALRRVFLTAGIWAGLYTLLMVSVQYFPDRYRVHVLIPMAVLLAAGITIALQAPLEAIAALLRARGPRAAAALVLVSLQRTVDLWAIPPTSTR